MLKRLYKKIRTVCPLWTLVCYLVLIVSLAVYLFAIAYTPFADFINRTVSQTLRMIMALIGYLLPFSLFEILILIAIPIVIIMIIAVFKTRQNMKQMLHTLSCVLAVISVLLSSYIFMLGIGYRTSPLSWRMNIEMDSDITKEELYSVAKILKDEVNALAREQLVEDGVTHMEYGIRQLSSKLTEAYGSFLSDYEGLFFNFPGVVKPVLFSSVMTDMGITGIYGYPTGEANVNISFPDYNLPFTAAHELAHQRGIAREDEANFVAFLVCISSEDSYIRYSGYLNMLEYVASALYRTDPDGYREIYASLSETARGDISASGRIVREHQDSFLYKLMDKVNDIYLKSNGTPGAVSYSYVARLAVSYYNK